MFEGSPGRSRPGLHNFSFGSDFRSTEHAGGRRSPPGSGFGGRVLRSFLLMTALSWASWAAPVFKLYLEHGGVYAVTYEELVAAGLTPGNWQSATLGLTNRYQTVPILVADGDDGTFGPGDRFIFVGEVPRGEHSYLDEYSRYNCYFVHFDAIDPARFLPGPESPSPAVKASAFDWHQHLEQDLLRLRFHHRPGEPQPEVWYWAKLVCTHEQPFEQEIRLAGLDRSSPRPVKLRLGLRGWSRPAVKVSHDISDHRLDVTLDGQVVDRTCWDGTESYLLEIEVGAESFAELGSLLQLKVPTRLEAPDNELLVDIVMLNFIEVTYPHGGVVGPGQTRLLPRQDRTASSTLRSTTQHLRVFTAGGQYLESRSGELHLNHDQGPWIWALDPGQHRSVDLVVADQPSRLRAPSQRADYIMICHHSLVAAVTPLADLHRRRGLTVRVVDVQDVFDEFSAGLVNPAAVRSFLQHAYRTWSPPPRFVLLVGDASWDFKNVEVDDQRYADWTSHRRDLARFRKNSSTPYSLRPESNYRNLVPTRSYQTYEGPAAADNWFACLDGDDEHPDLAIGRLPVVDPAEVRAIVAKTIAYVEEPELGPWRRNLLFIASDDKGMQSKSDRAATQARERGYVPVKIYPKESDKANQQHTQSIVKTIDGGLQAIHFLGHGGRYIWRTGPPDLKKKHDLFTLDHLDQLQATRRLPVVLSLTCYSAPFDHPNADSIGEKLLRLPKSGAIAVLAASWRTRPAAANAYFGRVMLEELARGGTIGEAIMRGKVRLRNTLMIQTYNLLGDPAAPTAAPGQLTGLELVQSSGQLTLTGVVPQELLPATALVELVTGDLVTHGQEFEVKHSQFSVELVGVEVEDDHAVAARIYCWSDKKGRDAVGWVESS